MAVLSNNGRLISSLPMSPNIVDSDELLLQSGGVTKRVTYSKIKDTVFVGLDPYSGVVKLTNGLNKISGSFYGTDFSNFDQVLIRTGLTVIGDSYFGTIISSGTIYGSVDGQLSGNVNGNVIGNLTGNVTGNLTGNVNGNVNGNVSGNLTGNVTGDITSTGGTSTFTKLTIARLTSSNAILGDLRGDVYTQTGTKVLENGSGATTTNGGIPNAYFYGTSSYSSQALTAAYAAAGGSNALPSGGSQYQVITLNGGGTGIWTNPITASSTDGVGVDGYITTWAGNRTLKNLNNFYYNGGMWNSTVPINADQFISTKGFYVAAGSGGITGSFVNNKSSVIINSLNQNRNLYGNKYGTIKLELSQSGMVTMSLNSGQSATLLVKNSGAYNVLKWSGSLDGGSTANTKIYWKSGSIKPGDSSPIITVPLSQYCPQSVSQDVFVFTNVSDRIFGAFVQNYR